MCGKSFPILYKFEKQGTVQCLNLHELGVIEDCAEDVSRTDLHQSVGHEQNKRESNTFTNNLKHFKGPSARRMFVQMCIIAGTDYLESVHGVGLIAAQQAVIRNRAHPDDQRLQAIVKEFQKMKKNVPEGYLDRLLRVEVRFVSIYGEMSSSCSHALFMLASISFHQVTFFDTSISCLKALFHYQPVYDPNNKCIQALMPVAVLQAEGGDLSLGVNGNFQDAWKAPKIDKVRLFSSGNCHFFGRISLISRF